MRLRRPCEHDRYDEHETAETAWPVFARCPGGEFLPEDALILVYADVDKETVMDLVLDFLDRDDADQVGEPG